MSAHGTAVGGLLTVVRNYYFYFPFWYFKKSMLVILGPFSVASLFINNRTLKMPRGLNYL